MKLGLIKAVASVVLFLGIGASHGIASWKLNAANDRAIELERQRDSLAIEGAAERSRADGWVVAFADTTKVLRDALAGRDDQISRLVSDLQASGARVASLMSVVASAESQIQGLAAARDTLNSIPEWWTGQVDDGLLTGGWRFDRIPERFGLNYNVEVPMELISSEGGDGRWLVTGRSEDPCVSLLFSEVLVEPRPPVVEMRCAMPTKGKWFLVGSGFGAAVWEIFR